MTEKAMKTNVRHRPEFIFIIRQSAERLICNLCRCDFAWHSRQRLLSLPHEVLGSRLVLTAVVMLQLPLRTHRALLHAHDTNANPTTFALDSVTLFRDLLAAGLALVALLTKKPRHGRNRLGKYPATASSHLTLVDAVERAFIHDDDPRAAYNLKVYWADHLPCFEHGLA